MTYTPSGYYRDFLPKEVYELYKNKYWSNHSYTDSVQNENYIKHLEELGINRKIVAEKYGLKPLKNIKIPEYAHKEFQVIKDKYRDIRDHNEYFITKDKEYVCIFSRYYNDDDTETILDKGYCLIEPIYNTDDKTFIKKVPKRIVKHRYY